ncbi:MULTISPECIES: SWIM zinc finger family protein [unclassified Myxococcus]
MRRCSCSCWSARGRPCRHRPRCWRWER